MLLLSFWFIQLSSENRQNRTNYKPNYYIELHNYVRGWGEKKKWKNKEKDKNGKEQEGNYTGGL